MMVQRLVLLLLVMLIVCLGCGTPMQKLKKITWTKDGAEMAFVPGRSMKALDTYDQFGDTIPGGILQERDAFYMDTTEVTVGQFKKFLKSSDYKPAEPN